MQKDNLFDSVDPLEQGRHEALKDYCASAGISDSACEGIVEAARLLREFELYKKPHLQTTKEKVNNFENIADLCQKLQYAIAKTEKLDKIRVHGLIEDHFGSGIEWPDAVGLDGVMGHIFSELRALELAATEVAHLFALQKKSGGRRTILHEYYFYLEWIWESVKNEGFVIGRNNPFERLCDAVFLAAGVPAGAEGAVRFFSENKEKIDADRRTDWW